tara:strand:+ start:2758 stop:3396 length:639 start_codon:yes stop_codon:yes gene_type:complete
MEPQIRQALSRSVCGGWDRGFLESILEQIAKGRTLSEKQTATVSKVLTRNDEKAQTVHDQWEQIYYEQHAVEAKCLASYYKQTGYFKDLARDILAGAVPELIGYTKMSTNKYAQKVLAIHKAEPKYAAGSLVSPRANFQSSHAYFDREDTTRFSWPTANDVIEKFKARGGFIMEVTDIVRSAAKGAKTYKILPIGATNPIFVEERHIKINKR